MSQSGTVEKWFDLRLILGHLTIISSFKDVSGLRVLYESVGVVNVVVGCVVEELDLAHCYWLLLTGKLKLNCI